MPTDVRANDIVHWQTAFVTRNANDAAVKFRAAKFEPVSTNVVAIPEGKLGFKNGFLVRDPDGHALLIIEK